MTVWMKHALFQGKRYPEDPPCSGNLVVINNQGPIWEIACDKCDYEAGLPARDADPKFRLKLAYDHAGFPAIFSSKPYEDTPDNVTVKAKIAEWLHGFNRGALPAPSVFGLPGRGKSHLLVATCKDLLRRHDVTLWFRSSAQLLDDLQDAFGNDEEHRQVWKRATTVDVLALDDLGAEQATDWREDRLARLVDERYMHGRPILVASNYPPAGWAEMIGERTVSRLRSMTFQVELTGADRRVAA